VIDFIPGDETVWEHAPLEALAREGELMAYYHKGFWQPMDTVREKMLLEKLWQSGKAPWRVWT
jgi:glucose-1-phosphate cytidylyltransferase